MRWIALAFLIGWGGCNRDAELPGPVTFKYVLDDLRPPGSAKEFAFDQDGDGKPDNFLGSQYLCNLDCLDCCPNPKLGPSDVGKSIVLLELTVHDPQRENDAAARVTLRPGVATPAPDFSGRGMFRIDGRFAPATVGGPLVASSFDAENPLRTRAPVTFASTLPMLLFLPLLPAADLPAMNLDDVHIQFKTGIDPQSGAPGLLAGELHGTLRPSELVAAVARPLSATLTARICPGGLDVGGGCPSCKSDAQAKQLQSVYDQGGCGHAKAMDCVIDPCEVETNPAIRESLRGDVHLYDKNGKYAPDPANPIGDSISIGFGFTAVQAAY